MGGTLSCKERHHKEGESRKEKGYTKTGAQMVHPGFRNLQGADANKIGNMKQRIKGLEKGHAKQKDK